MNWKEIGIGAASSLLVTVLGGVAIYYWTKDPSTSKSESLRYSLSDVSKFQGGTTKLGFNSARIRNDGGVAAKEVLLSVRYPSTRITDFSIESTTNVKPTSKSISGSSAEFTFARLLPSEAVTITLLTDSPQRPKVILRSDTSLGKIDDPAPQQKRKSKFNEILGKLLPILVTLAVVATYVNYRSFRSLRKFGDKYENYWANSKNNMGFILFHRGMVAEAESLFRAAVKDGEDADFVLSNLAACVGVQGDPVLAGELITAAKFAARAKHAKGVIAFNEAVLATIAGDREEAFAKLEESCVLSGDDTRLYAQYSVHLAAIRNDPRFQASLAIKAATPA